MRKVFADTSYFQAWLHARDSLHQVALAFADRDDIALITSEYVLLELGALMSRGPSRIIYSQFVRRVCANPITEVISGTPELFSAGLAVFDARPDKNWSLTDCTSFAIMQERGIQAALTGDHHFQQAGFEILLVLQ